MNHSKQSLTRLFILASTVSTMTFVNANQFEPATTPIFNTSHAKPNIHMMLDDSASMKYRDIMMPEHGYSFGQPICDNPGAEWSNERRRLGEYDPFSTGQYVPWDDNKAVNGLIDGKRKPPRLANCAIVARTEALKFAVNSVLYKYRDNAYMGISFLWQVNDDESNDPYGYSLMRLPIGDYSGLSQNEFMDKVITPVNQRIDSSPGRTPMYPAVYEAIKMYRGQPMTNGGVFEAGYFYPGYVKSTCDGHHCFYPYTQFETPLRYRCQQNHLIVMTDGVPNEYKVWGIGEQDDLMTSQASASDLRLQNVNQSVFVKKLTGADIGRLTSNVDLRSALKPINKNGQWVEKHVDDAGKPWMDELSERMPIFTHSVSLYVDPLDSVYTDMTRPTEGMNLGFGQGDGNAEDLFLAFDTIFSSIIKSTSSTLSTNDRVNASIAAGNPLASDGEADVSEIGTIRYDSTYNFNQHFGKLRAMVPYLDKDHNGEPFINVVEIWNTDETIQLNEGNYLTFLDFGADTGSYLTHLDDSDVLSQFKKIHSAKKTGESFNEDYIKWLTNAEHYEESNKLRSRLKPMGSMTSSDIVLSNKDMIHINAGKETMSSGLSNELIGFLKHKAKHQPANYIIVADNDGFINFINAQRGLTNGRKAGSRDTAYFPQLLAHRLDEIAKDHRSATLVLEGKTNLVDAKVYQPSIGDLYATIGLTSMGSGGKGLVGYRVYGAKADLSTSLSHNLDQVTPLFEITNEGPVEYRTTGFKDLGYTYSGFEFFNHTVNGKGQAVAVFGNGFGVDKSILYFIDAYTGEKLHEIALSHKGGGASTPSIIVRKSPTNNGQVLERIYVGDYSGTLYRVDFNGQDFTSSNVLVTALFDAATVPNNPGQAAISTKPLVTKNKSNKLYSVAFGTGNAESQTLDRGPNSLVEHSVYNIVDNNISMTISTASVGELALDRNKELRPQLTIDQLKVGKVNYAMGANIDYSVNEKHDLDIVAPTAMNPNSGNNGWAMRLIADGTHSGERTIQNPKYDSKSNAIVFATWGIHERGYSGTVNGLYDPCLSDDAFGKILSFNAKTGASSGKKGIYNQGSTGNAEGGLTGDGVLEDPEGNSMTDLNELDPNLEDELTEIIGEDDSSYTSDDEQPNLHCIGDIFGRPECVESEIIEQKAPLQKGRIDFKKINAYY